MLLTLVITKEQKISLSQVTSSMVLRYSLFVVLICSVFIACTGDKEYNERGFLLGSWAYCEENGNYTEIHYYDGYLILCHEFFPMGNKYLYSVDLDTLLVFNYGGVNNKVLLKSKIILIGENEMEQQFTGENGMSIKYHLKRIDESVSLPQHNKDVESKNDSVMEEFYLTLYKRRMTKFKCKSNIAAPSLDLNDIDTSFTDDF